MFTVSLFVFCVYANLHATAQTKRLDSLIGELPGAREDTNKAKLLHQISAAYFETDPEKGIKYGEQALKLSAKLKYQPGLANGNSSIARCYAVQNKYTEALKYYQDGLIVAHEVNKPALIGEFLTSIGAVYSIKGEHDKAQDYLVQAKKVYEKAGLPYTSSLINNFGTMYSRMKKFDEALQWYLLGIKMEEENEVQSAELERLYTNVGGLYVEKLDYSNGLKYLFKALALNIKKGADKSAAFTYYNIGSTYLQAVEAQQPGQPDSLLNKKRNLERADYYLHKSLENARTLKMQNVLEYAYHDLSHLYGLQGNYQKALTYFKTYKDVHDSLRNFDEEKAFARVEAKYIYQKKTDSLNFQNLRQQTEIERRKSETKLYIVLSILIALIGVIAIRGQRRQHKQKIALAEAEKKFLQELAQKQLEAFTKNIQEKDELLEKYGQDLEKYQSLSCSNELSNDDILYNELKNSVILTEKQWNDFQNMFDQCYTGYIDRLKTILPDVSKAEMRYLLLSRLQLTNKQMAGMLGVGLEAIRVNKYRILKKLTLPEGTTIEQFVQSI